LKQFVKLFTAPERGLLLPRPSNIAAGFRHIGFVFVVASLGDLGFDLDDDFSATFLARKGPHPPLGPPLHAALDDEYEYQRRRRGCLGC
jgi:hypothetical protein